MDIQEHKEARPTRKRLSVKDDWPVAVIAAGLIATAVWIVVIGWAGMEVLHLVL